MMTRGRKPPSLVPGSRAPPGVERPARYLTNQRLALGHMTGCQPITAHLRGPDTVTSQDTARVATVDSSSTTGKDPG